MDIKAIRKALNMSQSEMARQLKVAEFTIRRWEKGEYKIQEVHRQQLERLAKKAGLTT